MAGSLSSITIQQEICSIQRNLIEGFPDDSLVKNLPADAGEAGDPSSIPGSGRSPGEGDANPLQYSCLGNPMDRGAWQAIVHGVTKSPA